MVHRYNPYLILDVDKDADSDRIRKRYLDLVYRFHPDRNPGDAFAPDKVALFNLAYEWLENDERRRLIDESIRTGEESIALKIGRTLARSVSAFREGLKPLPDETIRVSLTIPLESCAVGCQEPVEQDVVVACRSCGGTGYLGELEGRCTLCDGTGAAFPLATTQAETCPRCSGFGFMAITTPLE